MTKTTQQGLRRHRSSCVLCTEHVRAYTRIYNFQVCPNWSYCLWAHKTRHFSKLFSQYIDNTTTRSVLCLTHPMEGKEGWGGWVARLDAVTFLQTGSIHLVIKAREQILVPRDKTDIQKCLIYISLLLDCIERRLQKKEKEKKKVEAFSQNQYKEVLKISFLLAVVLL